MKKIILLLSTAAMFTTAMAQEEASSEETSSSAFKQSAGDKSLEFQFNSPFVAGAPFTVNGIRFRSFSSETFAIRVNAELGSHSTTAIAVQNVSTTTTIDNREFKTKNSNFQLMLAPGFETHFDGTDKLSPYVGAELPINFVSTSTKTEKWDATEEDLYTETAKGGNVLGQTGGLSVGINAVAGFDFYFTKQLYIGAEMSYGFAIKSNATTKFESDQKGSKDIDDVKQGSNFNLGTAAQAAFRLGFLF